MPATTATEPEIEILDAPPEQEGTPAAAVPPATADAPDAEDDDLPEGDARGHEDPNATEAEREAIRVRRRDERKERKERQELARRRERAESAELRRENQELQRRMAAIEQHTAQSALSNVDAGIAEAQRQLQMAEEVAAKAIAAQNGNDAMQAWKYRDEAAAELRRLQGIKQQATQAPKRPAAPAPSADTMRHAQQFVAEHKAWYDPSGANEDSAIVRAIDEQVLRDGYDPGTPEYWAELRKRAARRLPERFTPPAADRTARGGPPVGTGRADSGQSPTKFYVSPDRKKAMQDANLWDDPVKRQKVIREFIAYDRNNPQK